MSIWNDAFDAYLDVEYNQEVPEANPESQLKQADPLINSVSPKAIYIFVQLGDVSTLADGASSVSSADNNAKPTKLSEQRLDRIERQYESLVAHFGEDAIEAAKRALMDHIEPTDHDNTDQLG